MKLDFGSTSTTKMSFFPESVSGVNNRLLEIDNGSAVTNVGLMIVTRSKSAADRNNAIRVTGGSSLSIAKAILGYDDPSWGGGVHYGNNGASFTLDGGSSLNCTGAFQTGNSLGWDSTIYDQNIWARFLGEDTKATIGGTLSVGADSANGGHHVVVADGASVSAGAVTVGASAGKANSYDNSLVISNGGSVVTKAFNLSTAYAAQSVATRPVGDSLQVLDGGSFTNVGNFYVGWYDTSNKGKWGATVLVSNGTFRTSGGEYRFGNNLACSNHQFIVSGPRADVTIVGGNYYYFISGGANRYIFENQADYTTSYSSYSYTANVSGQEIRVKTGATFRFPSANGFKVAAVGSAATVSDSRFVVESDATATGTVFRVGGRNNTLAVSNALVQVSGHPNFYYALDVGNAGSGAVNTNAHLVLSGDSPRIVSPSSVQVANGSDVTFNLPASGYVDGLIPIVLDNSFNLNSGCALNLVGAEEMLKFHYANKLKRSYTLIKTTALNVSDAEISRINGTLPSDMSLRKVYDGLIARWSLILDVKPKHGLLVIVK